MGPNAMLDDVEVICPYCGQAVPVSPDIGSDADTLSTDCTVCCRPMLVHVRREEDGSFAAWAESEHGG